MGDPLGSVVSSSHGVPKGLQPTNPMYRGEKFGNGCKDEGGSVTRDDPPATEAVDTDRNKVSYRSMGALPIDR